MQEIDTLITGGKALLLDYQNTHLENAAIAVNASEIVAIGQAEQIAKKYRAKKTISAKDSLIMPGFVNCHTHAAMTCFRGIADDSL